VVRAVQAAAVGVAAAEAAVVEEVEEEGSSAITQLLRAA
jgi:hypothetical protein